MSDHPGHDEVPWTKLRIASGFLGLLLTAYGLLGLGYQIQDGFEPLTAGFGAAVGTVGMMFLWFAVRGHSEISRMRIIYAMMGGAIIGGIGFSAGFVGPLIFTPGADQGPLLGIFITGPLGFVAGTILGAIVGLFRVRH